MEMRPGLELPIPMKMTGTCSSIEKMGSAANFVEELEGRSR